jgi:hypothetical protein
MNPEHKSFKIGIIGELLVKLRLNEILMDGYTINTGTVDRDSGTDIVIFHHMTLLTAQVKTGLNKWNYRPAREVDMIFRVKLVESHGESMISYDHSAIKLTPKSKRGIDFSIAHQSELSKYFNLNIKSDHTDSHMISDRSAS